MNHKPKKNSKWTRMMGPTTYNVTAGIVRYGNYPVTKHLLWVEYFAISDDGKTIKGDAVKLSSWFKIHKPYEL